MVEMVINSVSEIGKSSVSAGVPVGGRPKITAILRNLSVGQSAKFPIEMAGSVRAVVSRMNIEKAREKWRLLVAVKPDVFQIVVTRSR